MLRADSVSDAYRFAGQAPAPDASPTPYHLSRLDAVAFPPRLPSVHSHTSPLFEFHPILESASVSRISCSELRDFIKVSESENVRCASPVELPSSRYYSVNITAYFDFDAQVKQLTCSMHVCQCGAQSSCHECEVAEAKEYTCRLKIVQSGDDDTGSNMAQLVGYMHPFDTTGRVSPATKFVFKVYAATDDDGANDDERTLPPLGPWRDSNGKWTLDPEGGSPESPDAADSSGIRDVDSGVFSRVACTGVTHDFEAGEDTVRNWDGHRGGGYMSSRQNVCVFDNVCLRSGGEMTMFLPPHADGLPPESSAYNEEENHIGYVRLSAFESWEGRYSEQYNGSATQGDYPGWRPAVERSSIPESFHFADDAQLHIFQRHSHFFQHYGHLIVDDVLAAFAGMELFSLAALKATLVLMPECPCCFPETSHELCARFFWNNDSIAGGVFSGGAKQSTHYADGTCFKKVLMGHSSALSSAYPNPLISVVARKFRSLLVSSVVGAGVEYHHSQWGPESALVNISSEQDGAWNSLKWGEAQRDQNCSASQSCQSKSKFCHRILMYNKTSGYSTTDTMKALTDVCGAVPLLLKRLTSCSRVICADPASMPLRLQLLLMSSATVIVSPHGGISSNVLFSNDGAAALLLVGPGDAQRRGAKDTHIYPWLTWLTVRYWLGTGNQDRIHDLVVHILLLAHRVERGLAD